MRPTIGDLISISEDIELVSLSNLASLREELAREPDELSLPVAAQMRGVLEDYIAAEGDEAEDALSGIIDAVMSDGGEGSAMLVGGPARSGKSHLLAVVALLLEYAAGRRLLLSNHAHFAPGVRRIEQARPVLVVPVPLDEHRGDQEHLEDIIFDRTAQELARAKYDAPVPLSQQSYALDLIERHIVPRYADELNDRARHEPGGYTTWEQLRRRSPAEAITVAQRVAQELGYPLDFRQSRIERLSRLLQLLLEQHLQGVVWLIDDLSAFLASVDRKAIHSDCSFLEFLGQRSKIEPVHIIAAIEDGLEHTVGLEPYLMGSLRALYDATFTLSSQQMTRVARQRIVSRTSPTELRAAREQARASYQEALGELSFTDEDLAETYPLHPLAQQCLQAITQRFGGAADGLLQFVAASAAIGGLGAFADRPSSQLIGPPELIQYVQATVASHPEASPYFNEVLDFYERNITELVPENPDVALDVIRCMIVLRLGNVSASAKTIAECMGTDASGAARLNRPQARQILETLRLTSSYVDVRRGPDPESSVYLIDAYTNLSDLVRQRLNAVKATFADDDARLWQRIVAACDSPVFPLTELTRNQPYEVIWQNTTRCAAVQIANLASLTAPQLEAYAAELADPATPEDCQVFVGELLRVPDQEAVWSHLQESAGKARWYSGLVAWLPRALTAEEMAIVKQAAACHQLLQQPPPEVELQSAWRSRLVEERMTLDSQVRQIATEAYYHGEIATLSGLLMPAEQLLPTAGDWTVTLSKIAAPSLGALFPDFPAVAPHRVLTNQDQINRLVAELVTVGELTCSPGSAIRELAEAFLLPLRLVEIEGDKLRLDASNSAAAEEILNRIRQRDQTPQHEQGRPLSCPDLAQHLLKSPLGLPPHLFELAIATLVRLGYLIALDAERQPVRFEDIPLPFAGHVHYIARPALLPLSSWQALGKVTRIVLDQGIPGPSLRVQHEIWEQLVAAREVQLDRIGQVERQLDELAEALGQAPEQWANCALDISAAAEFYEMIDPAKSSPEGISEFIGKLEPYLEDGQGSTLLRSLLRRITILEEFLNRIGPELIRIQRYLTSPLLQLPGESDLGKRRTGLLAVLASGEEIISDQLSFHRVVQVFLIRHKRHYLNWHSRAHRNPIFEHYRRFRASPEYRALAQLQGLDIKVEQDAAQVGEIIQSFLAQQCSNADLADDLDNEPICPQCHIRLGQELQLPSAQELVEATEHGLGEYFAALSSPSLRPKLSTYALALPQQGDVNAKLHAITELTVEPSAPQVLKLLTDDVIGHINRVLAGKTLIPRDFGQLRDLLAGRALTKQEAQALFGAWLQGAAEDLENDDLLQIDE